MRKDIAPNQYGSIIPPNYYVNQQIRKNFDLVKQQQAAYWDGVSELFDYSRRFLRTITLMGRSLLKRG